jgi:hypothetical protein
MLSAGLNSYPGECTEEEAPPVQDKRGNHLRPSARLADRRDAGH